MTTIGVQTPRPSPARIRSHRLAAPTLADVRRALERSDPTGADAAWATASDEGGLDPAVLVPQPAELAAATAALARQPGRAGLVGRAVTIRLATYRALAVEPAIRPAPARDWARESTDQLLRDREPTAERADELLALAPFAPESRARMDRTAALVAHRLDAPVGLVTVVLDGAVQIVGSRGLSGWLDRVGGMPIEWSFCARLVRTREPYVLRDTAADVLQRYNPLVVHDAAAAYAGAPLTSSRGQVLGSCCVLSDRPREFTAAQVSALETIARATVAELEAARRPVLTRAG